MSLYELKEHAKSLLSESEEAQHIDTGDAVAFLNRVVEFSNSQDDDLIVAAHEVVAGWKTKRLAVAVRALDAALSKALPCQTCQCERHCANECPHDMGMIAETSKAEVLSMPVISTAHLSVSEAARLTDEWPTTCYTHEFGFIVYFGSCADLFNAIEHGETLNNCRTDWPGFCAAAEWAEKRGFGWIRFDRDADTQLGLEVFDW